jgi:hypothetical protein
MSDQPIAWGMPRPDGTIIDCITPEEHAREPGQYTVPLYAAPQPKAEPQEPVTTLYGTLPIYDTAPQPRRRLTDQEICELADATPVDEISCHADTWHIRFGRAIEAAVWGEKT